MSSIPKSARKRKKLPRVQFETSHLGPDARGDLREFVYRVRDTGDLVVVAMTNPERWEREENGFLTLPDGREARYAPVEHIIEEKGISPELADKLRLRPKWPMKTCMMGVNPSQVAELRDHLKQMDVRGVEVKADGTLEISDRRAHREYCLATGLYQRNAGYGDAAPNNK